MCVHIGITNMYMRKIETVPSLTASREERQKVGEKADGRVTENKHSRICVQKA